nr:hypothetical protein Iba_chr09cCG7750 [Ipomoea batatas]
MASFSSFAPAKNAATAPLSCKSWTPPTKNAFAPSSLFFLFFCFHHYPPPPPQEHKQLEDFLDGGVAQFHGNPLTGPARTKTFNNARLEPESAVPLPLPKYANPLGRNSSSAVAAHPSRTSQKRKNDRYEKNLEVNILCKLS